MKLIDCLDDKERKSLIEHGFDISDNSEKNLSAMLEEAYDMEILWVNKYDGNCSREATFYAQLANKIHERIKELRNNKQESNN